jgi:hypothetical protein
MTHLHPTGHRDDTPIYDAVRFMTKDEIEATVRRNAAAKNFDLKDEHMSVIRSLIEHYKHEDGRGYAGCDGFAPLQFLEEAYEFKGGRRYLHRLFGGRDTRDVLAPIHELVGLPVPGAEPDGHWKPVY